MRTFTARLRGSSEVPPVRTNASGSFLARLSPDGRRLNFVLVIRNIRNANVAHIHLGRRGVNGPIVVFLFGRLRNPITVRRRIFRGTITQNDLVGPLKGRTLQSLVREILRGNAYVNVHTTQNPNGEIRGQIIPSRRLPVRKPVRKPIRKLAGKLVRKPIRKPQE
jgi:hypothetical protein